MKPTDNKLLQDIYTAAREHDMNRPELFKKAGLATISAYSCHNPTQSTLEKLAGAAHGKIIFKKNKKSSCNV